MKLEEASLIPPQGLCEFLADLGDGENGVSGTRVHDAGVSLQEFLQTCCDGTDEPRLEPGLVPQTTFWVLDSDDAVVGMVKVRHRLAESTRINGGHIGFYIHSAQRRKGYGKQALTLALAELMKIGEPRALITVFPENIPSIRIVEANGGELEDAIIDPRSEHEINRYWIQLRL